MNSSAGSKRRSRFVLRNFCRFISSVLSTDCYLLQVLSWLWCTSGEILDGKVGDRKMRLIQVDGEKIRHILSELFRTARGTLKRAAGSEGSLG